MLNGTEAAVANIKEYLSKNNLIDSAIRVAIQNSCSGAGLGLALDSEKEGDKVYSEGSVTFLVAEGIFADTGAITVDFVKASGGCGCGSAGFKVSSEKPLASGGGCGSSCSSGSCGC